MLPPLEEATDLLARNEHLRFKIATETLWDIAKNAKPKQKINTHSNAFKNRLRDAKGALRFLRAIGFKQMPQQPSSSSDKQLSQYLILENYDQDLIHRGKLALKEIVRKYEMQRRATEAARNAEAAQKLADLQAISKANRAERDLEQTRERELQLKKFSIEREDFKRQRDPTNLR